MTSEIEILLMKMLVLHFLNILVRTKILLLIGQRTNLGKQIPNKYSPANLQFALSLHFFSVKAYQYVRQQFNTILPHPRTLSKWYSHLNAEPGFTSESLNILELKVKNSPHAVFGA